MFPPLQERESGFRGVGVWAKRRVSEVSLASALLSGAGHTSAFIIPRRPHSLGIVPFCGVLLTAAAYVLMQELRLRAAGTACARAQVDMLRERLLKLGARVLVSVRRVVVHLPASFPFLPAFRRVALALGAATG